MIVWLASYPKSGNTWLRAFLSAYFMTKDGEFNIENLDLIESYPKADFFETEIIEKGDVYKYWESSQKNIFDKKDIRFLKTHNALISRKSINFTYPRYTLGVIYIIRDPRNVITSTKNHNQFETYDEAFEYMKNENAVTFKEVNKNFAKYEYLTSWRTHYQSWMMNKAYRMLSIKYEDMEKDPYKTFRDVVVFINAVCKFNNRVDETKIKNSIESTTFDKLKKFEEDGLFKENVFIENKKTKPKFFYLGKENNWMTLLNDETKNKMNTYYQKDLIDLGYEKN